MLLSLTARGGDGPALNGTGRRKTLSFTYFKHRILQLGSICTLGALSTQLVAVLLCSECRVRPRHDTHVRGMSHTYLFSFR